MKSESLNHFFGVQFEAMTDSIGIPIQCLSPELNDIFVGFSSIVFSVESIETFFGLELGPIFNEFLELV